MGLPDLQFDSRIGANILDHGLVGRVFFFFFAFMTLIRGLSNDGTMNIISFPVSVAHKHLPFGPFGNGIYGMHRSKVVIIYYIYSVTHDTEKFSFSKSLVPVSGLPKRAERINLTPWQTSS